MSNSCSMPFWVGSPLLKSTFPMRASTLGGSLSGSGVSLPGSAITVPPSMHVSTAAMWLIAYVVFMLGSINWESFHLLDIWQRPTLVEERCCRAVGPKPYKEPFGRASIYPVALETLRCLWTEPQVDRAVVVELELVPRS